MAWNSVISSPHPVSWHSCNRDFYLKVTSSSTNWCQPGLSRMNTVFYALDQAVGNSFFPPSNASCMADMYWAVGDAVQHYGVLDGRSSYWLLILLVGWWCSHTQGCGGTWWTWSSEGHQTRCLPCSPHTCLWCPCLVRPGGPAQFWHRCKCWVHPSWQGLAGSSLWLWTMNLRTWLLASCSHAVSFGIAQSKRSSGRGRKTMAGRSNFCAAQVVRGP